MTVAIVGVGETDYSFKDPRPAGALVLDAVRRALDDAGLQPSDVDGFVTETYSTVRNCPVDEISHRLGVRDRAFSAQMSLAGAGIVGAPQIARLAIEAGLATTIVCYYGASYSHGTGGPYAFHAEDHAKVAFEMPFGFYGQPVYFANLATRYRHEFGLSPEELGSVAVSTRQHAVNTPNALLRTPMTIDDYLQQPVISDPLRRPDCCLINDGAIAYVITDLSRARDLAKPPVVVQGVGMGSKNVTQAQYFTQASNLLTSACSISAPRAYSDAGVGPQDIDFAEIYDCFSISMIIQMEDAGLAPRGEGFKMAAAGELGPGGSIPVNTHGGLLSQSYLVGGNHVVEAVRQLRGEREAGQVAGAEVGLVAGLGSMDHATLILAKDR
jgi:acetyl-CoA acetyltransferase